MKAAWNPVLDAFICFYTCLILEENDGSDPWFLSFDHRIPGDAKTLVVCARWVNNMKTSLADDEFMAVTIELDRSHDAQEPFNMAVADFKYWRGPADHKLRRSSSRPSRYGPTIKECIICHRTPLPHSYYCTECQNIAKKRNNMTEELPAFQEAWNKERQCFICYLTGLEIELKDPKSPRYLSLDHRIPRQPGTQGVAVAFVNLMKTDLTEDEFWLVAGELADHFRTGKAFNRNIIKFAYWKRPRMTRKRRK